MRKQLALQAMAITAMVVLAYLIPLAVLVDDLAADRALTRAERDAESVARFVAVLAPTRGVEGAIDALRSDRLALDDLSVIASDGEVIGLPVPDDEDLTGVRDGVAFRAEVEGGQAVYVPLVQSDGSTAAVRVFVTDEELSEGVARSWRILAAVGVGLVVLAVVLFDRLGRSVVRSVGDLSKVTERLESGETDARVEPAGPREVVIVGEGLNRLAERIDVLLQEEREAAANLSHRLRTPLAAARLSVEGVTDVSLREQLLADLDDLDRSVDLVISEARRPARLDSSERIDLAALVTDRVEFWTALADEQGRQIGCDASSQPVPVRIPKGDAEALIDALIGNVFAHTPDDATIWVSVLVDSSGEAVLAVEDSGPGFPDAGVLERGRSGGNSTGLGLDIVAGTARSAGGSIQVGVSRRLGGAMVVIRLPADNPPIDDSQRSAGRRRFSR